MIFILLCGMMLNGMNNERLKTLIYNAIVLLEENGYTIEEFKYELGMTLDEYDEIFNEKEGN